MLFYTRIRSGRSPFRKLQEVLGQVSECSWRMLCLWDGQAGIHQSISKPSMYLLKMSLESSHWGPTNSGALDSQVKEPQTLSWLFLKYTHVLAISLQSLTRWGLALVHQVRTASTVIRGCLKMSPQYTCGPTRYDLQRLMKL